MRSHAFRNQSLKLSHSNLKNEYKMQEYLCSENLSTQQKQTLFMLQTRMVEVKANFSEKYDNILTCHFLMRRNLSPTYSYVKRLQMGSTPQRSSMMTSSEI